MPNRRTFVLIAALLAAALGAWAVYAETVELVTYYPASAGNAHSGGFTVGSTYQNEAPADGNLLLSGRLGIGLPSPIGAGSPIGPLHVVGANDALSEIDLFRGNQTAAPGNPELRVRIIGSSSFSTLGSPSATLQVVGDGGAAGIIPIFRIDSGSSGLSTLFVRNDGYVGIGATDTNKPLNTSPQVRIVGVDGRNDLEISGLGVASNPRVRLGTNHLGNNAPGSNPAAYLELTRDTAAGDPTRIWQLTAAGNGGAPSFGFGIGHPNQAASLSITTTGNIGIGTTAPQPTSPTNNISVGNLDTNDVYLRSAGRWASQTTGGPRFIAPVVVYNNAGNTGIVTATQYNAATAVPVGATAVILEAEASTATIQYGAPAAARIMIQVGTSSYRLLVGRSNIFSNPCVVSWSNQGVFPISSNRTFSYSISSPGFSQGATIRLIGYYS